MKKTFFMLLALMAVAYSSYAQDGKKFIGIWEPVKSQFKATGIILFIGNEGKQFVISSNQKKEKVRFAYSKKDDTLIGKMDGDYVIIKYFETDKHILMMPQNNTHPIEFKKTSYSQ